MSNYRIVSRAYPRTYWAEHGDEIVATANELHSNKWSFRESRQLASNGLRTRSFEATGGELRQVWVQGLLIYLVVMQVAMIGSWLGFFLGLHDVNFSGPDWTLGALAIATFGMAFSTRWPVMLAVGLSIATGLTLDETSLSIGAITAVVLTAPIAMFGRGRRVIAPSTMIALALIATVASIFDGGGAAFASPNSLAIFGLLLVRFDARVLAAATVHAIIVTAMGTWFVAFPPADTTFPEPSGVPLMAMLAAAALVVAMVFAIIIVRSTRKAARLN